MIKKGDVSFDCEKCIRNRRGISPLNALEIVVPEPVAEESVQTVDEPANGDDKIVGKADGQANNTEEVRNVMIVLTEKEDTNKTTVRVDDKNKNEAVTSNLNQEDPIKSKTSVEIGTQ